MSEQQVPQRIRQKVDEVLRLLNHNGIEYQQVLAQSQPDQYEFLFPKSKYYRYYTHQLFERGPSSQHKSFEVSVKEDIHYQGTAEIIQVGAMAQVIKEELAQVKRRQALGASPQIQGHQPYRPLGNQIYQHQLIFDPKDKHLQTKVDQLTQKFTHLVQKKKKIEENKQQKDPKEVRNTGNILKVDEWRRQLGTNSDGSLGAYGGKKYEGLGMRDEFQNFRRQMSQNYYSSLQDKLKQS